MSKQTQAIAQLKKASKLAMRAYRKNGPKSYKKGQGALLKILHQHDGKMTSRELVDALSYDRKALKDIVRKAQRNGYVTIEDSDEKKTYIVVITETGSELAEKRCETQTKTAERILSGLTEDEVDQLNALTEKIIVSCKDLGAYGKRKSSKKHRHGKCRKHRG